MSTGSSRRAAEKRSERPKLALIEPLPANGSTTYFDASFYLETYPDVAAYPGEPRDHYLRHGSAELRYPNPSALEADIRLVRASGQFDAETFLALYGSHDDPVRQFLVNYRFGPLRPNTAFDGAFVAAYYRRSLRPDENPFLFYCRHRARPWCYQSMAEARAAAEIIARSPLFDADFMRANYLDGEGLAPEVYYLTEGFRLLQDPSKGFSTAAYLYDNPDIVLAQMNPLLHYETAGRAERRPMACPAAVKVLSGGMKPDPNRKTVLLVSHQASRTGAPILLLNLLRRLNARFNVVTLLLEGGALVEDFRRMSCAVAVSGMRTGEVEAAVQAVLRERSVDCVLLNTVVCAHAMEPLVRRGLQILTLIHDFAQYTRPLGLHARTVAFSNRVIYPASLVRDAALGEIEGLLGQAVQPSNVEVRAQGRCLVPSSAPASGDPATLARALGRDRPGGRPLAVIGAGYVEPRKGVDLFIEAARVVSQELGVDCRFVWIGGGYRPDTDAHVSVYLQDQVRKCGLEGVVVFVDAQDTLEPWMAAADAFFMSSRLDPYPNVVLDALAGGLPVVCFEGATGSAELAADFPELIRAAPYLRTREAAELLVEMGRRPRRAVGRQLQRRLDFEPYAEHIASALEEVAAGAGEERRRAQALVAERRLQADSLAATLPAWLASPLTRVGPTRAHLAGLAARVSANGLPIATLAPGAPADGGRYPTVPAEAADGTAGPDVVLVWADGPEQVRALADHLFQTQAAPRVLAAGHKLTRADLSPLSAVLPRDAVQLLTETGSGGSAAWTRTLMAAVPQGSIVQLLRLAGSGSAATLDSALSKAACAALGAERELDMIFARAAQGGPTSMLAKGGLGPPAHLIDQRQCWVRAEERLLSALAGELTASFDDASPRPAWGASGALVAARWAVVEPQGNGACDFDLTWGRREIEVCV